ncbi:hypothetical protein Fcan01_11478 [Folsomia candida]|uniref:Uncharacterized protein n=1 Tax=Folsomia candida TaxID=158441 RepID=A0A226EB96_FOLCA|nr:hypothetical protein Fcan01_11478 [Folsomia candida]
MEMIVPTIYESPWKGVMDVEGIRVPFDLLAESIFDGIPPIDYFLYKVFYLEILMRTQRMRHLSHSKLSYMRTGEKLFKKLIRYFGMNENFKPVPNGTFSLGDNLTVASRFNKTAILDYPIQPMEYDEQDSCGVIKSLKTCGKDKVKYVKGDGDSFFTRTRGCITNAVRGNYVEKRLKAFISSGIFAQWRVVYASWKPRYLLGHNGNRIGSNVDKVSRLDFSSKITTVIHAEVQELQCSLENVKK